MIKKPKRLGIESVVNALALIVIFLFLLYYFKPDLLLLETTTSGGDTASHNWPAHYLKSYLLPKGRLIGWDPGWYAGYPLFQFYFPFAFVLMALLSYATQLQIAFKLVTALGSFLLPVAAFAAMRLMKFKFPVPILAAIFALPFLFMEANSMWGGNIPSTLAGEFSYSISLAFTVLFFGLLYCGIRTNKFMLYNAALFAGIALTHVYTMLFAILTSAYFLIGRSKRKFFARFKYLFVVYFLSSLLVAFWLLPLIAKLEFTTAYNYVWRIGDLKEVFPDILLPFYVLAIIGFFIAIKKRDDRVLFIAFSLLAACFFYLTASKLGIVDIRFVPFLQFFPLLIAAYGLGQVAGKVKAKWLIAIIVLFVVIVWVNENVGFIDIWIKWNYEGFESKVLWPKYSAVNSFLSGSASDPRVVYEHSSLHDAAGTVRAFESLPLFSGRSTLEGLYMQSIATSPFVFYIQSEISQVTSCPLPGYSCTSFNSAKALKHLEMFNVKHVIARTDTVKNALTNDPNYKLVADIEPYKVYEVEATGYVVVPEYEPVAFRIKDWKRAAYEWFKREDLIDMPLVFAEDEFKLTSDSLDDLPRIPLHANCSIEEEVFNEEVRIRTNCVGKPHIIRISYFPNWQVEGADKVYLVSPSFMLIYPKQENVRLYYDETAVDTIGKMASYAGVLIILAIILSRSQRLRRLFSR